MARDATIVDEDLSQQALIMPSDFATYVQAKSKRHKDHGYMRNAVTNNDSVSVHNLSYAPYSTDRALMACQSSRTHLCG